MKQARINLDRINNSNRSLLNDVFLEVQSAYINLQEAAESIPLAQLNVEKAKENLGLAQGRYNEGIGDVIELKEGSRSLDKFKAALEANASRVVPKWLEMDKNNVAKMIAEPAREDIDLPIEEHLIVELYSKYLGGYPRR